MGIGKAIKKAVKSAIKGGGSVMSFGLKKPLGLVKDALGLSALKDMAQSQEAAIRAQGERAKLDAVSEVQNVTQFDDSTDSTFAGATDTRRKKRPTGGFGSGIGIVV